MFREKEFSEVSYVCQELGYYLVIVSEEIYASTNTKKLHRVRDILPTLSDGASSFPSWSRSLTGSDA